MFALLASPSGGHSTPIVWGDRIFLTERVEDVEKLGVSTETAERLVEIVDAIRRIGQSKRGT